MSLSSNDFDIQMTSKPSEIKKDNGEIKTTSSCCSDIQKYVGSWRDLHKKDEDWKKYLYL